MGTFDKARCSQQLCYGASPACPAGVTREVTLPPLASMFRFKTLGNLDLREEGRPPLEEALAQPKRVALLAYLALQGGAFVRRDTVLALLWPELDTDRARHSLRQALYLLRRWLNTDVIVKRGEEELAIDPRLLWCDAVALPAQVKEGKVEEALAVYGGDFLAGYHVPDASEEFEDWIIAVRQECRTLATRAAMTLVEEAQAAGRWDRALEFARKAASIDPVNETVQVALITLLGQRGDVAGARRAYRDFEERMKRELGAAPSRLSSQALAEAEKPRPVATPLVEAEPVPKPRASRRIRLVAVAVLALGLSAAALIINRAPQRTGLTPVLAIAPVNQLPAGSDSVEVLPIADLLATSLSRLPSMQVLSNARLIEVEQSLARDGTPPSATELARRAQATELLEGTVYRIGPDSMVLELRRIDVRSGKVLHGYRVGAQDVFQLVDRATAEIARAAEVAGPAQGIADVTTQSLVAFRFYQEGLRSFYGSDLSAARRLFQSAVNEDSTFAMAMWYLGRTEGAIEDPAAWNHYYSALRLAARVSERERLLITSAYLTADNRATAKVVAESLTNRFPSDPDGLWILGVAAAGLSDYPLATATLRRAIALDSSLDVRAGPACRLCEAYESLIFVYIEADSIAIARAVAEEFAHRVPTSAGAWSVLAHVAWAQDDSIGADRAEAEFHKLMPGAGGGGISTTVLRLFWRGDYNRALDRMISIGSLQPAMRDESRWYAVIALRNLGRLREALDLTLGRVPRGEPAAVLNVPLDSIITMVVRFEQGDSKACAAFFAPTARRRPQASPRDWPGRAVRDEAWGWARVAMCRAEGRDSTDLAAIADTLERLGVISGYGRDQRLHHYVRGLLWRARGNEEKAVTEFRAAISSPNFGFTRINYELGQSLLRLGRPMEAVAILQPALRGALDASNLYVTRTAIDELLARAWDAGGGRDSARAHWAQVDRAWTSADPPFRSRWETAHRQVTSMQ